MFRLWAKIWESGHMRKDMVVCNEDKELNRTRKIFAAIEEVCNEFDLSRPIWLDNNIAEFKSMIKYVLIKTILLMILTLIILKYR